MAVEIAVIVAVRAEGDAATECVHLAQKEGVGIGGLAIRACNGTRVQFIDRYSLIFFVISVLAT